MGKVSPEALAWSFSLGRIFIVCYIGIPGPFGGALILCFDKEVRGLMVFSYPGLSDCLIHRQADIFISCLIKHTKVGYSSLLASNVIST
jgi:hypothetical protein